MENPKEQDNFDLWSEREFPVLLALAETAGAPLPERLVKASPLLGSSALAFAV